MQEPTRKACSCDTCQSWCQHVPGWFKPGEAEKAAELKGMSLQEFFKQYLTVDYWAGDTIFVLRPATVTEAPGEIAPANPLGQCIFYKNGLCEIHDAKPHECATVSHDETPPDDWHKRTADSWKPVQEQVTDLLGFEPEEPEFSLLDAFSMMLRRR